MNVSFALFSDAANISQEGKLNILGIFDAVHVNQFPALHPRATFVLHMKATPRDTGTHPMLLRWVNPRGTELWNSEAQLDIGSPPPGQQDLDMPIIVQLDLPLDMLGDYTMRVAIDGRDSATCVLHVRGTPPAPVVPAGAGQLPA
ncbi:MAG: hypothetical protein IBJ03_01145 [Gemmatimonadaceae bacterium]|nr:hypothetical protein [Gemmatimonadaceae bacterium]